VLLERLPELRGKVLGCWCAPLPRHGDLLATLADYDGFRFRFAHGHWSLWEKGGDAVCS
jgi:hypothetical protein